MVKDAGRVPPKMRTPVTEGAVVVSGLASIWESWTFDIEVFWNSIFKPMWDDKNTKVEPYINELELIESSVTDEDGNPYPPGGKHAAVQIGMMRIACAFAVQAMRLDEHHSTAWSYTCEAHRWLGLLQGFMSGRSADSNIFTLAKMGADARHAETREMKAYVFEWYVKNKANYKSMDKAAEAFVRLRLFNITVRTIRSWIGECNKLQSAGKL
jgi:hypothetical protein